MNLCVNEGEAHLVLLNYVEYMCRCGLYQFIPQLKNEVDTIYRSIDEQGICRVNYYEKALKGINGTWRHKIANDVLINITIFIKYA